MASNVNTELREFLRTRRARLSAADAPVLAGPDIRRVPGLRREEVAALAGVSVDYYARLEQGRHVNASDGVLDAISGALQLDEVERRHLHTLVHRGQIARPPTPRRIEYQQVRPGVLQLLRTLDDIAPALVLGRRLDVLAANRLAGLLIKDFPSLARGDRNLLRFLFLDPDGRERWGDWEEVARNGVAVLRADAGRHPDDPQLASLIGELSIESPEFRRWWADFDVTELRSATKVFRHPLLGEIALDLETLNLPDDPDQQVSIYTAPPGSAAEASLRLLAETDD